MGSISSDCYTEVKASDYDEESTLYEQEIPMSAISTAKRTGSVERGCTYWLDCQINGYKIKISCRYPTIFQDGSMELETNSIIVGLYVTDTWLKGSKTWFYRIEGSQIGCKNTINILSGYRFYALGN